MRAQYTESDTWRMAHDGQCDSCGDVSLNYESIAALKGNIQLMNATCEALHVGRYSNSKMWLTSVGARLFWQASYGLNDLHFCPGVIWTLSQYDVTGDLDTWVGGVSRPSSVARQQTVFFDGLSTGRSGSVRTGWSHHAGGQSGQIECQPIRFIVCPNSLLEWHM